MTQFNYAITAETHNALRREEDYSVGLSSIDNLFDAKTNSEEVVHDIVNTIRISDRLLYSAASALQRQSRINESAEEWAEQLSNKFFDDL